MDIKDYFGHLPSRVLEKTQGDAAVLTLQGSDLPPTARLNAEVDPANAGNSDEAVNRSDGSVR